VPGTIFPASAHYVALGHLHRPQSIAGPCPIWYSGSPLQLDFGETADTKAVLPVEAVPGVPASVREVPLQSGRRLRNVRGSLAELRPLAGTTGDDWLRVFVREPARAGLADEVRDLFPEAVDVVLESPERPGGGQRPDRQGRWPHELFGEYLAERGATDERVLALFDELYEEAHAPHPA
jgi:exonuclease SbcD